MAIIPNNAKANVLEDIGLEVLIMITAIVLIGNKVLEGKVHKYLQPLLLIYLLILVIYLIFPSKKFNYGKSGYMRVIIFMQYGFHKMIERSYMDVKVVQKEKRSKAKEKEQI